MKNWVCLLTPITMSCHVILGKWGYSSSGVNRGTAANAQAERAEGARATVVGAADQTYATGAESEGTRRR